MSEVIGLIVGVGVFLLTFWAVLIKGMGKIHATIFSLVAIIGGLTIPNYNNIQKLGYGDAFVLMAKEEIDEAKFDAIKEIRNEVLSVRKSNKKLTLSFIKAIWLTASTKNQFGTQKAEIARKEVVRVLNENLHRIIPDVEKRKKFINEMNSVLNTKLN